MPSPVKGNFRRPFHAVRTSLTVSTATRLRLRGWEAQNLTLGHLYPPAVKLPDATNTVTIDETTLNIGTAGAPASKTRYYLSATPILDASATMLGERDVPPLLPNGEQWFGTGFHVAEPGAGCFLDHRVCGRGRAGSRAGSRRITARRCKGR